MAQPSSPIRFAVRLHFLSDWHVGEGAGQPKHLDRILRRDPLDRLPYVPAKTWLGLWRDGCERIAFGLDEGEAGGPWQGLLEVLFGDEPSRRKAGAPAARPLPSRLQPQPARLAAAVRQVLAVDKNRPLRDALVFTKPGVKIDEKSSAAEERCLHFDEVARGGVDLDADVSFDGTDFSPDALLAAKALLWAGAYAVERLGGKRRRGLGRCTLQLVELEAAAAQLRARLEGKAPVVERMRAPTAVTSLKPAPASDAFVSLPLRLQLLQPVIIPERTVGNVVYSRDFIPGTHLLGPITQPLAAVLGTSVADAVARGDIRLRHAYPEVAERRGRPMPLAWFVEKDATEGRVYNRLVEADVQEVQLKQLRRGYVAAGVADAQVYRLNASPLLMQATHSTIDEPTQRPTGDVGGVFTYQAIKPGTVLHSELLVRRSLCDALVAADPDWSERLWREVRLGRSKKDDYGLVALTEGRAPSGSAAVAPGNNLLFLWLQSDLILRGPRLRGDADLVELTAALQRHFPTAQLSLRSIDPHESVLARGFRSDGWLSAWALPRPTWSGFAAGSCFVFTFTGTIAPHEIQSVVNNGLGERRSEGFGEVAIDDPLVAGSVGDVLTLNPPEPSHSTESAASSAPLLARLQRVAWERTIDRVAGHLGGTSNFRRETLGWTEKKPGNTQLGTLRSVLLQLDAFTPDNPLQTFVVRLGVGSRKERWLDPARAALDELAAAPELIWKRIEEANPNVKAELPQLDGAPTEIKTTLWGTAVRRVLLAALRAERRARETTRTEVRSDG